MSFVPNLIRPLSAWVVLAACGAHLLGPVGDSAAVGEDGPLPEVKQLGSVVWPGALVDKSGLTDLMEDGSPQNRLGGFGSGVAWTGRDDDYVVVPDRGPGDGAASYRCRYHTVQIRVESGATPVVTAELTGTRLLSGPGGEPLVGLAARFAPSDPAQPRRFDPEAIRVLPDGNLLIADEYGPGVWRFGPGGEFVSALAVPRRFVIASPSATPKREFPPFNVSGRQPNRGIEGLALSPDGKTAHALLQGPLLQDGAVDAENERIGRNVRWIVFDVATGRVLRELVYVLDKPAFGLNEVEALSETRFLVIERDGKAGAEAKAKRIQLVDTNGATDVSGIDRLPGDDLPAGVRPVRKRTLIDLLDPRWGFVGAAFPEKTEGLALGPTLADGSRVLVVTSDNDFQPDVASRIDLFSVK
jgi:hypothetical protein